MIELIALPIDITYQIRHFRDFLVSAWPSLDKLMQNHDWGNDGSFSDDWIQINWELLVERELLGNNGHLIPLGWNERITDLKSTIEYKVICKLKTESSMVDWINKKLNYNNGELLLSSFCTPREVSYGLYPPFDFVDLRTLDKKKLYIVPFDSCNFFLQHMKHD